MRKGWEETSTGNRGLASETRVSGHCKVKSGVLGGHHLVPGNPAWLTERSGLRETAKRPRQNKTQGQKETKRRDGEENRASSPVTRAPASASPVTNTWCSLTCLPQSAWPSPVLQEKPAPPPSPPCSLRAKTPGYKLIQHSCYNGEKPSPLPLSPLTHTSYPLNFPLATVAQEVSPNPNLAQYKRGKKTSHKTYVS